MENKENGVQRSESWEKLSANAMIWENKYSDYAVYTLIIMIFVTLFLIIEKILTIIARCITKIIYSLV